MSMHAIRRARPWALVRALSLAFALALPWAGAQAADVNDVSYTIRDMTFDGPSSIPAGMTRLTFVNEAEREDLIALVTLSGGRSLEEFFATMELLFAGEISVVPDWIQFHGGSPLAPAATGAYTIFLSPGTHYLLSIEGDEEGPFAARGLLLPIEVEAPEIESDVTIVLQDYEFVIEGSMAAGKQVVRVHNAANQPHEVLMIPLPPGMTLEDMFAMEEGPEPEGDAEGGPPGGAMQGMWALDPGKTAYVTVDLQAGTTYAFVCFIPDADGPHAMQGMAREVRID
jgi:hypothetical protein